MTVSQKSTAVQFEELDEMIQEILGETANQLARETRFVQRKSLMDGAHFAQGLIFGCLSPPEASYSLLQEMLAISGCQVSAQALEKRMTAQAADFLLSLLYAWSTACVASDAVTTEILNRFEGVYLQDGTVIGLPNRLQGLYRGFGGNTSESGLSALRVQARLNVTTGAMQGPWIAEAVQSERQGPGWMQQAPTPAGALLLTDNGYITLHEIKQHQENQRLWMSHARADFQITDAAGVKYSLPQFGQKKARQGVVDEWVTVGSQRSLQQKVRLIAFAVSQQSQHKQQERAGQQSQARAKGSRGDAVVGKKHQATKTKRHRPSKARQALAGWTVLLTNVPKERLAAHEARVLIRVRWQIELLWRLWKERGQLDIWRSAKPMRILCEIYAKLMGCMIQHWIILKGCWQQPDRSMVKASQVVQTLAPGYLLSWSGPLTSAQVLQRMGQTMNRCRLNHRPTRLSTAQLLEQPDRVLAFG
jgi:Transposase DDE domain